MNYKLISITAGIAAHLTPARATKKQNAVCSTYSEVVTFVADLTENAFE
jgi:hypothetical protein